MGNWSPEALAALDKRIINGHPAVEIELDPGPAEPHWRPWGLKWKQAKPERQIVYLCANCHELKTQPEYVFALQKGQPTQGLFSAFYVHFLTQWSDLRHPEYDFSTRELIYRNDKGNELKRRPFPPQKARSESPELILLTA